VAHPTQETVEPALLAPTTASESISSSKRDSSSSFQLAHFEHELQVDSGSPSFKARHGFMKAGGKKGGTARMAPLTPGERKELAKKAIQARWAKAKKKQRKGAKPRE